jgi:nucleoside-diphosphate-sugar epimerase
VATVKPDTVYHLAGAVTGNPAFELVLPTYHSHLTSTVNLLTALAETGCRRVVVTGTLVEPPPGDPEPVPHSPYAAAKWAGVGYARMFHALYAVPAVIVRLFMTYGPSQAADKIIPSTITALLKGAPPRLSSGVWLADWAFVDDVIEGMIQAASVPGIEGATFELGSGRLNSIRTMVETLVRITGSGAAPIFGALPDRPGNSEIEIAANTAPAAERLGWTATTSIESGLRQTVEWHRAQLGDES